MSNGTPDPPHFTARHRELLSILSDGDCHTFGEIMRRMGYDDDEQRSLITHVSNLRRLLRPLGRTVILENSAHGPVGYRHVILVTPGTSLADGLPVVKPA